MPPHKKSHFNYSSFFVAFCLLLGLFISTEIFAYRLHFHPILGNQYKGIYFPWKIVSWAWIYWNYLRNTIVFSAAAGQIFVATALLICLFTPKLKGRITLKSTLYGSARWADRGDIEKAGLLGRVSFFFRFFNDYSEQRPGVYVGAWQDNRGRLHFLKHNGPEHVLTYAPTRSGKGVGLVIPTLLDWYESCVVSDLKGELWQLTAGWRQKRAKNKVLKFEPADFSESVHWNPLEEIRLGTEYEFSDIQNLVSLILDPDGKGLETHWQKTAFSLLNGVILYVLYTKKEKGEQATLYDIDCALSDKEDMDKLWEEMINCYFLDVKITESIRISALDMKNRPPEEAGSVLSTAKSYLSLYRDPVIRKNTSKSDFFIKDLMHYEDPVSLYIVTQPSDLDRLKPLVRILINMIIRVLTEKPEYENGAIKINYKHRLLMMLDEFPALGKLDIFQRALGFIAGYGIKCYLICQDINQLKSKQSGYGEDETITSNCHIQNAFPPNRIETAEYLSRLSGETTVVKEHITKSFHYGKIGENNSRSLQEVKRPLLTPDECLRLKGARKNSHGQIEEAGDMIIYVAGFPAIYGKQILYFQNQGFKKRASINAPKESDVLEKPQMFKIKL